MYCKECGEKFVNENSVVCVKCGSKRGEGSNYCAECGSPVKNKNAEVCLNCGSRVSGSKINISKHLKNDGKAMGNSKVVAGLLAIFLGAMGIHRFYLGYKEIGFIQLAIFIVALLIFAPAIFACYVWAIIDAVQIFTGKLKTINGEDLA
ncbi:NINE protein [Clostridium perfringens]